MSRFMRFRYLQRKRTIALIVILTLVSTLFSVTAYSFLGFYNGFTNYIGEEEDVLAVYSTIGSTPFTGIVPLAATNNVASLSGVTAVSPEVIAPSIIDKQSVFVRGVLPNQLAKINSLKMVEGEYLLEKDTESVIIGQALANRLNLKLGQTVLIQGVLSQRYSELKISGIFQTTSSLNDEAIASICVGQWLRGLSYTQATVIRTKIDLTQTNPNQLYQELSAKTNSTSAPSPSPTPKTDAQKSLEQLIPITSLGGNLKNIGVERSQEFMQSYLNRYGISKDTLIVLSIVVVAFASATALSAITLFVKQHSYEIDTLRSIGVSQRKIKRDLLAKMTVWAVIATLLGTLISAVFITVFQSLGYLQVLSHAITFQLEPLVLIADFVLLVILIGFNVVRTELRQ